MTLKPSVTVIQVILSTYIAHKLILEELPALFSFTAPLFNFKVPMQDPHTLLTLPVYMILINSDQAVSSPSVTIKWPDISG